MVKDTYKLYLMRESGKISAQALKHVLKNIKIGITGLELNEIAQKKILDLGGQPSFKTVPGYKWTICITINEQVVHGIPTDRKIVSGDIVSIDLGAIFKGWHTDCAWSVLVKDHEDKEKMRFLKIGEQALWDGVGKAIAGGRLGDISSAIQGRIEGGGYYVVRSLVGHGIGKKLHEEPEVPGFGRKNTGMILKEGMRLAIEAIYTRGTSDVVLEKDGWTFSSADRSWAAVFEMTLIVRKNKAEVVTDLGSDYPIVG